MARWKNRRRRTESLECEAGEGIQENRETYSNQQHPENSKRGSSQQRCSNMPSANAPRHVTCHDSRSKNKEYSRTENRDYSPHYGILPCPLVSDRQTGTDRPSLINAVTGKVDFCRV